MQLLTHLRTKSPFKADMSPEFCIENFCSSTNFSTSPTNLKRQSKTSLQVPSTVKTKTSKELHGKHKTETSAYFPEKSKPKQQHVSQSQDRNFSIYFTEQSKRKLGIASQNSKNRSVTGASRPGKTVSGRTAQKFGHSTLTSLCHVDTARKILLVLSDSSSPSLSLCLPHCLSPYYLSVRRSV